ncbi:unnamed protein product [Allacma fusca]|uniref:Uncharacterized protein n=1 Tax=Allacma fusca TaxID=39272 RepID=A0A8J2PIN2_9HEXA|nr:unnamed protein product [Allacma fusca]
MMKKKEEFVLFLSLVLLFYFSSFSRSQEILFPENEGTRDASKEETAKDVNSNSNGTNRCDKLCIPLDLCPSLFELLESPNQSKIKFLQGRSCGFTRNGDPLVWCDDAICSRSYNLKRNKTPTAEVHLTSSSTENKANISREISARTSHPVKVAFTPIPGESDSLCGTTLLSRIHGGEKAAREEFPWIIALAIETLNGPQIICGGALISEEWVITAAHCVVDSFHRLRNISHIRVGAYDISKAHEDGAENVKVKSIFYHPQFRERPVIKNDIALLKLQKNISYSVTVGTICLPGRTQFHERLDEVSGDRAFIAGWGGNGERSNFHVLQKVEIPLISINSCIRSLMRLRVRVIPELQICGGSKNRDSCKGDSGGPLMMTVNGRMTLIGIISYGTAQCDGLLPGVYTRFDLLNDMRSQQAYHMYLQCTLLISEKASDYIYLLKR